MRSDLASVGGKGANLIRLRDAGFPVPEFVVVPTDEYRRFVADHGLQPVIIGALREGGDTSERIRRAFRRPILPPQQERILRILRDFVRGPVAVRSSATAEDLPDASFAGQQDSFLDVVGADAVLEAIVECWSSLWTERAISYRDHHDIDHQSVGLAVVVQEMVPADAAGVLFTADPITGLRGVTVIDAVPGLGERLVSGAVVPDHYELDARGIVVARAVQGEESVLTDRSLAELATLGRRIEAVLGAPQDVEFTVIGDRIQVVQSRPITTLYPLPDPSPPDAVWVSVGAFQGMLEPLTPMGRDVLQAALAGAAWIFSGKRLDRRDNDYLRPAGERLWARIDPVLRTRIGSGVPKAMRGMDPNAAAVVDRILIDGGYAPRRGHTWQMVRYVARFALRLMPNLVRALLRPAGARAHLEEEARTLVDGVRARVLDAAGRPTPQLRLAARIRAVRWFADNAFPTLLPAFAPIMGPSIGMTLRLRHLAARTDLPDADALALTVLRSLPGNVTTEMDLALWEVSRQSGDEAAVALDRFLERYGMRGVGEIDLGVPRWSERPEEVLTTMGNYRGLAPEQAPDTAYTRGRQEAEAALQRLAGASSGLAKLQVRFLGSRIRGLFGARETPKFALVQCLGLLRRALLETGADLVEARILDLPDDVFFLQLDELPDALEGPFREVVEERRRLRAAERRRARVPVVLVGDGRTYYDAGGPSDGDLTGLGVSPGIVEGVARVVQHPNSSQLRNGEILVCRGTDPAWTPLFLTASGLVTEVGGLMTHGSVVAREYGLPAVVGVAGATETLSDGRRIRLDGSAGTITFLD